MLFVWDICLKELQDIVRAKNALALRKKVCDFAQTSPDVARNRVDLQVQIEALGTTWSSYWTKMRIWNTYATGPVLICTSVMLGININMVETAISTREAPFNVLTGVFQEPGATLPSTTIYLGLDHDNHFQSLLPGPRAATAATTQAVQRAVPATAPRVVPTAAPAASPQAVPMAAPMAAPQAVPEAAPEAVQKAAPEAVPKAAPDADPKAATQAVPRATPVAPKNILIKSALIAVKNAAPIAADNQNSVSGSSASTSRSNSVSGATSSASATPSNLPTKCPACNEEFPQLMRHLRKKACADKIGQERLQELREMFKRESVKSSQVKYNHSDKGAANPNLSQVNLILPNN